MAALDFATERELATHAEQLGTFPSVVTGVVVGFADGGRFPLVTYPGQPGSAALAARSIVDLHDAHVGRSVVLAFEGGEPDRPIVMGCIRGDSSPEVTHKPGHVEVEADGERLVVSARAQLVLRCGRASITLTSAGRILIEGAYISSRATGVNRLKGGSVQLN